MKKPKKSELKEMFKEADEMISVQGTTFKNKVSYWESLYFDTYQDRESAYIKDGSFEVWNSKDGYAKILTYKEPKEESFVITATQLKQLHVQGTDYTRFDLEYLFPSAFEPEKKELVVGKWYKKLGFGKFMFCFNGNYGQMTQYGFKFTGDWSKQLGIYEDEEYIEATQQEVEEALKAEAVRIGTENKNSIIERIKGVYNIAYTSDEPYFLSINNTLYYKGVAVLHNGQWATIIQPKKNDTKRD